MRDISARELKGHKILAVERFWDNTRWMIEFSVLRPSTAYGSPGEEMRLFLTEDGYQAALQSQQRREIKIKRYARVIEGHILDFKPGKRRRSYPNVYTTDFFVDVTEEVMETIRAAERAEAAYERKMYRYKAYYSLDCDNGIENAILMKPQTPEMLLEEKQFQEQVYAAVMKLPEKQAKRIYARYYLGMTVNEIAEVEGVDPSRVRDSIRRGLKQLVKYF